MICPNCGKEIKDNSKFCGGCGARLDRQTVEDLNADKNVNKSAAPINNAQGGSETSVSANDSKKVKKDKKPKKKHILLRVIIILLCVLIAAGGVCGTLAYFGVVNIPIVSDWVSSMKSDQKAEETSSNQNGTEKSEITTDADITPSQYTVTSPDAESYFQNKSKIVSEFEANSSKDVHTEAEAYKNFTDRGFVDYPVVTEYSMNGDFSDSAEISDSSSTKHPMYTTYYVAKNGNVWTIYEVNGTVMATPVSYNLQSGAEAKTIISESNTLTSYDSTTNKFFVTIPNSSEQIVKTVKRIDAKMLESLTFEAIEKL